MLLLSMLRATEARRGRGRQLRKSATGATLLRSRTLADAEWLLVSSPELLTEERQRRRVTSERSKVSKPEWKSDFSVNGVSL